MGVAVSRLKMATDEFVQTGDFNSHLVGHMCAEANSNGKMLQVMLQQLGMEALNMQLTPLRVEMVGQRVWTMSLLQGVYRIKSLPKAS